MLPEALQSARRAASVNFGNGIRIKLCGADADKLVAELTADDKREPQATHRLALEAAVLAAAALGTEDLGQMHVLDGLVTAVSAALRGNRLDRARWLELRPVIETGRKVIAGAALGGSMQAEQFKTPRKRLWDRWLVEQGKARPISQRAFFRQIDQEEPPGIAPWIVGYDNIRHHWRVAKEENGG
jgi:hypothetical protein